ncbi:MAG TPA: hypothetical protein VGE02_16560 [Gemmatimonadales bacterium]
MFSPADEPTRYAADVTLLIEAAGDKGIPKRPPLRQKMRIERSESEAGDRLTTVDVTPAFSGVPFPVGAEDRVIGRLEVNETTGQVVLLRRSGVPILPRDGLDLAGLARTGASFGGWLRNAVITPQQLTISSRALRASFGGPTRSGQMEVYRHSDGEHQVELISSAQTGLLQEEVVRDKGRVALRTTYRYDMVDGLHIRAETRIVRQDAEGRSSTYVVSVENVSVETAVHREVTP